jgi:hypothetical protein
MSGVKCPSVHHAQLTCRMSLRTLLEYRKEGTRHESIRRQSIGWKLLENLSRHISRHCDLNPALVLEPC